MGGASLLKVPYISVVIKSQKSCKQLPKQFLHVTSPRRCIKQWKVKTQCQTHTHQMGLCGFLAVCCSQRALLASPHLFHTPFHGSHSPPRRPARSECPTPCLPVNSKPNPPETATDPSWRAVCQPRVLSPSPPTAHLHQTLVITHLTHSWRRRNVSPHLLIFLRDFHARALSPSEGLLGDTIPNSISNDSSPEEEE